MKTTMIGAALWTLCWQYFAAEAISIAGWPGRYSLSQNFISDLGAMGCAPSPDVCSPLHALMNGSFLLQGVLIVAGALLVWPLFPRGPLWGIALGLVGASGLGVGIVERATAYPFTIWIGALGLLLWRRGGLLREGVSHRP